jgi:hypothetical protein
MISSFDNPYSNTCTSDIPSGEKEHVAHNPSTTRPAMHAQEELKAWEAALLPHRIRTGVSLINQVPLKTLIFRKKLRNHNLCIWHKTEWDESQQYFAACAKWGKEIPDVTLHAVVAGQGTSGPVLGAAHFRCSRHVRFGVGDTKSNPSGIVWEEMRNVSKMLGRNKYAWDFTEVPEWNDIMSNKHPPGTRRFKWQRTHNREDGIENKLCLRNFRLTDEDTGAVVAVFVASSLSEVRKRGELRLFEELRPKVEQAVVLTCASISEKLAR